MARSRKKRSPLWFRVVLVCVLALLLGLFFWLSMDDQNIEYDVPEQKSADVIYEEPAHVSEVKQGVKPVLIRPTKGMALVMDDVGYNIKALERVLNLPFDVAISVLPGAPRAKYAAELAHADGQVVMLHLPMEPNNPKYQAKMTDDFLRAEMSEHQVLEKFSDLLTRIPYVQGVNNHMGSLLTTMEAPMRWVIERCEQQGLFFIDSKTASHSVAADVAADIGLPWAERHVFLDHSVEPEALAAAWRGALRCVERHGGCVVIAHPHPETLDFLELQVSEDDAKHIQSVMHVLYVEP